MRSAQNRGVDKSEYMVREEKVRGREGNSTRVVSTFSELQSARLCHLYLDLCTHTSTCTRVNGVWLFDNDRLHVPSKLVQIFATFNSERKSPSTVVFKQLRSEFEQFCCSASSHWKTILSFPRKPLRHLENSFDKIQHIQPMHLKSNAESGRVEASFSHY